MTLISLDSPTCTIVFVSIKMPHMNGIDFARKIREISNQSHIVFFSGYTDKEYLKGAIDLHVDGYIEKPLNVQEITSLLGKLAQVCKEEAAKQSNADSQSDFFINTSGTGLVCSTDVFVLPKAELLALNKLLRQKSVNESYSLLRKLCSQMRNCAGTSPDYMRNVFSRLALLVESAGEFHGAIQVQQEAEHFAYATASYKSLESLEKELFRLFDAYFDQVTKKNYDPVILVNDYLQKNYSDCTLTVKSLSQHLCFNTSYLCTVYKQKTGHTINEMLTELRIDSARKLLCESDFKLYTIGSMVGYPNGKYFTKIFMKEVGVSPRQYREQHHEK